MTNKRKLNPVSDIKLFEGLIEENKILRKKLQEVSSVGISMMYHRYKDDCDFTRDFLQAIVSITQDIELEEIKEIYRQGFECASSQSVVDERMAGVNS